MSRARVAAAAELRTLLAESGEPVQPVMHRRRPQTVEQCPYSIAAPSVPLGLNSESREERPRHQDMLNAETGTHSKVMGVLQAAELLPVVVLCLKPAKRFFRKVANAAEINQLAV